ncbi:hypothetical protein HNR53_003120 [Bacillus benzoevorans]|uniref:Minor capsid protein n=1 Tax=Bacillus benzoevorans TaxID=1456 RepID=A0A7X0HTE8_9BACI|nr:hypothetical protein [Bacillus benzoevorans]
MDKAQFVLDEQVLKDSNNYAPWREHYLIASSIEHSKPGTGSLIWETPYARRLYYNPQYNFSKDHNPLAGGLWFERAKAAHGVDWARMAQNAYDNG